MAFSSIESVENAHQSCLKKSEGEYLTIHMFVTFYLFDSNHFRVNAVANPIC